MGILREIFAKPVTYTSEDGAECIADTLLTDGDHQMGIVHAPKGGKVVAGKQYKGGQFLPGEAGVSAPATAERIEGEHPHIRTPQFKAWFGDWEHDPANASKVVDGDGMPKVVYHTTHHDFDEFSTKNANPENDWGKGIYFTDNLDDAASNYTGKGPDVSNKIERHVDSSGADSEDERKEIRKEAEKKFMPHAGGSVPAFINMRNPLVIGDDAKGSTFLDYNLPQDENGDFTDEPATGKLADIIDKLREHAPDFYHGTPSIEHFISEVAEQAIDGGLSAKELESIFVRNDKTYYITDDNGDHARKELLRRAIEDAGFDGIIDKSVYDKFGMPGMRHGTTHYIVFDPRNIKSAIGNDGNYDPKNPKLTMGAMSFDPNEPRDERGRWTDSYVHHDTNKIIDMQAENFAKKYPWGSDPSFTKEQFVKNWKKTLRGTKIDKAVVGELKKAIVDAHEKYGLPHIPIVLRKQTKQEKADGEAAHWGDGFIVLPDSVLGERDYHKLAEPVPLGKEHKNSVDKAYDDVVHGIIVHEHGHRHHDENPESINRGRSVMASDGGLEKIKRLISYYAATNVKELVAEAYAMSRHPDFGKLPQETRDFVNHIIGTDEKKSNDTPVG